jgi:hypothetical protein
MPGGFLEDDFLADDAQNPMLAKRWLGMQAKC